MMRRVLVAAALTIAPGCTDPKTVPIKLGGAGYTVPRPPRPRVNKADLLIVVDNSPSMATKQAELARRVPELIAALTDPTPDPKTGKPGHVVDLHVGVITSSLGSHGTSACATKNNRGRLVTGPLLNWVFGGTPIDAAVASTITSAGEEGCGYEETWEALYHFLIDPAPYATAEVKCTPTSEGDACGSNRIEVVGVDEELLAQRRAFLRPDSFLAVIILSNENDASLKPAGLNWLPWGYAQGDMKRGHSACDRVPDDFEPESAADFDRLHTEFGCWSCFENGTDPNCALPWSAPDADSRELRAFQQTKRFGYNFLWGRQRYVDAFTKSQVVGSDGKLAANPLFASGMRTQDLILVTTIVGVPPDLVTDPPNWERVQGPIDKRDARMIESIAPNGTELQPACAGATPGLRHVRIAKDLADSGLVASICSESFAPTMRTVATKIRTALSAECLRTTLAPNPSGSVDCMLIELLKEGIDGGRTCEQLGKGVCTPGAAPCRRAGSDLPPISVTEAASQLNLPILITGSDGETHYAPSEAVVENGNVYATASDGRKHLVCELEQLTGEPLRSCISDPAFTAASGFCYSQEPEIVGALCLKLGAPGTLRFLGAAEPRPGSQVLPICATRF